MNCKTFLQQNHFLIFNFKIIFSPFDLTTVCALKYSSLIERQKKFTRNSQTVLDKNCFTLNEKKIIQTLDY